ncbi:hypothetical protein DPEC_G00294270 [Dallia pectoralis]|uniref:Uncharacterized protein n=1 Tax=Dallia pectoralis TaxID=75939 RepID=A0ACC2FIH4_DALPE|nr:hypothetical protein DPEC_G00294270 [Dallia pectoralis]
MLPAARGSARTPPGPGFVLKWEAQRSSEGEGWGGGEREREAEALIIKTTRAPAHRGIPLFRPPLFKVPEPRRLSGSRKITAVGSAHAALEGPPGPLDEIPDLSLEKAREGGLQKLTSSLLPTDPHHRRRRYQTPQRPANLHPLPENL